MCRYIMTKMLSRLFFFSGSYPDEFWAHTLGRSCSSKVKVYGAEEKSWLIYGTINHEIWKLHKERQSMILIKSPKLELIIKFMRTIWASNQTICRFKNWCSQTSTWRCLNGPKSNHNCALENGPTFCTHFFFCPKWRIACQK